MDTIELEGKVAHLEQDKAEIYVANLELKKCLTNLANSTACWVSDTSGKQSPAREMTAADLAVAERLLIQIG